MTLKELSKTTQFVKNFKRENNYLKIGRELQYELDMFDDGNYSISIHTGVKSISSEHLNKISEFLNNNNFLWFIGVGLDDILIHVQ